MTLVVFIYEIIFNITKSEVIHMNQFINKIQNNVQELKEINREWQELKKEEIYLLQQMLNKLEGDSE